MRKQWQQDTIKQTQKCARPVKQTLLLIYLLSIRSSEAISLPLLSAKLPHCSLVSFDRNHCPPSYAELLQGVIGVNWVHWFSSTKRLQRRWSRNSAAAPAADPRRRQQHASEVSVVFRRSDAVRSKRCSPITQHPSAVRCTLGIRSGAAAVHFVHLRPHIQLIEGQGMAPHLYANDTHVMPPFQRQCVSLTISDCLKPGAHVKWNLNKTKTRFQVEVDQIVLFQFHFSDPHMWNNAETNSKVDAASRPCCRPHSGLGWRPCLPACLPVKQALL